MKENIMDSEVINIEKVEKVKKSMPTDEFLFDMAELFKVFGDSTRMKIISALLDNELCVGEIANITNTTSSAISHQLRVLKQAKLVKYRREGKTIFYSLDDDHVKLLYEVGEKHIEE
ncbi:MAG: ArsR/SmtB family transcription factor [Clostridia bacterium]